MDGTGRIEELEQKFAENPRRYFAPLANEYRKAGNPRRAMEICRAHLGQLPGHMSGQIVYGQSLFECGEYDQARVVFFNALAMDRENLIVLRQLGDLAVREGDTTQARQWYTRLLQVDPKDTVIVGLVNEMDAASDGGAVSQAPAQAAATEFESAPVADVTEEEDDEMMAEELGFPLVPPPAFVTETMAELYLAQGFKDRALETYRQLAAMQPDNQQIQARLAELETPDEIVLSVDQSPPESPPVESLPAGAPPSTPDDSSAEPSAGEIEPAAAPLRPVSVREFFAALGARRPSARAGIAVAATSSGNGHNAPAALTGAEAADRDRAAATALAGAFSGASAYSQPAPIETAPTPRPSAAKESEEDMARFRAWLDGLTG